MLMGLPIRRCPYQKYAAQRETNTNMNSNGEERDEYRSLEIRILMVVPVGTRENNEEGATKVMRLLRLRE